MPPVNNEPTDPNATPVNPVTPPVTPATPSVEPVVEPTPNSAPVNPFGTPSPEAPATNSFGQTPEATSQPVAPMQSPVGPAKPGFKLTKKMAIIGGVVVVVAVIGIGAFTFLKAPIAQIASNVGLSSIALTEYKNDKFKFSIQAPEGWEQKVSDTSYDSIGIGSVTFTETIKDVKDTSKENTNKAVLYVSVSNAEKATYAQKDETEYFNDAKESVQATISQQTTDAIGATYKLVSEESTTINGLKAYKVKYSVEGYGTEDNQKGFVNIVYVFVNNSQTYRLSLSGHESEAAVQARADAILNSFKAL